MGCPKIVPKGNLLEMVSNWQISIGYEDNQIMTLQCLRKHGLYAKANKCEWHQDSIEFLRYILMNLGLKMADEKVKIIQEWPEPED